MSLHVLNYKDNLSEWVNLWRFESNNEPFCSPYYCKLFEDDYSQSLLFYWKDSSGSIILPLIKKSINEKIELESDENYFDLVSPYGYGGPFFCGNPNWDNFWRELIDWSKINNIISCFIRFSLMIPDENIKSIQYKYRNKNIIRNLDINMEDLWYDYEHKVRKNVKKAKSFNLEVEIDDSGKRLDDFMNIYYKTMDRRGADQFYYFSCDFFENIVTQLKGNFLFFHTLKGNNVISTELVLISEENIYSLLGGTLREYYYMRPNDLLKHEIILWGIKNKKKMYILGGGYAENDGIYQYKKSFSPNGIVDYKVGEIIINENRYIELIEKRKHQEEQKGNNWIPKENYFPAYRS